jgi:hypothetical protein
MKQGIPKETMVAATVQQLERPLFYEASARLSHCFSDLISYEEKAAPNPSPVRAIRIC